MFYSAECLERRDVCGASLKLHAILDRGTRRDFFDLYVLLERHRLGLIECWRALREVYRDADINEGLVLRALSYFDDAEAEARLPGEGAQDFARVKAFFQTGVAALLLPPTAPISFGDRIVDVDVAGGRARPAARGGPCTRAPPAKSASRTRRGSATGDRKRRRS